LILKKVIVNMRKVWSLFSWRSWGLIRYNSVWQNVAALFYVGLARQWSGLDYIRDVLLFLIFSLTGTAYGYLINDLADVELDRRAGKPNVFHGLRRGRAIGVTAIAFGVMVVCGLPFAARPDFLPLWIAWALTATFYSLPPVRLKERGAVGLVATILAQQPLPAALAFAALGYLCTWGALVFIAYITLRGISSDVGHQMRDRARDEVAGATTFAVRHGHTAIARLYGLSLEVETLLLGAVLIVLLVDAPPFVLGAWAVSPVWPLLIAYLALLPFTLGRAWMRLNRGEWIDPYDESPEGPPRDLLHLIHHPFPTVLLPLYLALWLTVLDWPNVVFVVGLGCYTGYTALGVGPQRGRCRNCAAGWGDARMDFDVVVIGAGPSGAAAAREIAQGGGRVALLERDAYPGQRAACGGGIEGADLELLGLPDSLIQRRITRREHHFPWGHTVIADPHVITLRQELDRWLAEESVAAGAELFTHTRVRVVKRLAAKRVEVTADDRATQQAVTYTARLAIFADGPHTLAPRAGKLGFTCTPATAALGLFYELAWPNTPMAHHEIHFAPAISPWGYLWIFPARDLLNVGLTVLPSSVNRTQTLEARLRAFIDSRFDLRDRPILRRAGGHIPVVPAARFYDDNMLVVGDAAGMVDALTDAGIANGVCGGRLAGQTACEALASGDYSAAFLARYQARWQASPRGQMTRFQSRLTRALLPVNRLDPYLYAKVMQILFLGRDLRRWQKLRLLAYPLIRSVLTPDTQR